MKKTLIISVLIILLVIIFIATKGLNKNTFTHSSGAFSFNYPKKLIVTEKDKAVIISSATNPTKPLASISFLYYPNYLSNYRNLNNVNIVDTTIAGRKAYTVSVNGYPIEGMVYLIPLDDTDKPSSFLTAVIFPSTDGLSNKEFYSILSSLTIDDAKINELIKETSMEVNIKATEAKLKATLANVRPSAELYYDQHGNYTGLCNPVGNSKYDQIIKTQFQDLINTTNKDSVTCLAKSDAYAASVKLPRGNYWCVDSTGYMNEVTSAPKKYSCK